MGREEGDGEGGGEGDGEGGGEEGREEQVKLQIVRFEGALTSFLRCVIKLSVAEW